MPDATQEVDALLLLAALSSPAFVETSVERFVRAENGSWGTHFQSDDLFLLAQLGEEEPSDLTAEELVRVKADGVLWVAYFHTSSVGHYCIAAADLAGLTGKLAGLPEVST